MKLVANLALGAATVILGKRSLWESPVYLVPPPSAIYRRRASACRAS